MVKVTIEEWVGKYERGVREAATKYVDNAVRFGVPKLRRWAGLFIQAHQAAPYLPVVTTDAERLRNVQTSWNTTRGVRAQYRGRGVAGIAGALAPITVA
jgi:hypothetical protein